MDGFRATFGRSAPPLQLVAALENYNGDDCGRDKEVDAIAANYEDECDSLPRSASVEEEDDDDVDANDVGNGDKVQPANSEKARDVLSFFQPYLPNTSNEAKPHLQPMSVLQQRYNDYQHKIDKQAKCKSIKSWFRDRSEGKDNESYKMSEIIIPDEVAKAWGLQATYSSGRFPLSESEMQVLQENHGGDVLLSLFGEYRSCPTTNVIQFKSKKGAQKSAAFNLLLVMDLQGMPTAEPGVKNIGQLQASNDTSAEEANGTKKERFQLESIKYYGAVQDSEGDFLSPQNPCMIQCIVSIRDYQCQDTHNACLQVRSGFHLYEHDSLKDASEKLKLILVDSGSTASEMDIIVTTMGQAHWKSTPIDYEIALPKWSTETIGPQMFLYELEFSFCKKGSRVYVPLSEVMDLDVRAATRIGILLGDDLFPKHDDLEKELCSDFTLMNSSGGNLRVKMCSRTEIRLSEMKEQISCASSMSDRKDVSCPITFAKCFNKILFDHGKNYGLGPMPHLEELSSQLDEANAKQGSRSYLFLPLRSRQNKNASSLPNLEIDWETILGVMNKPVCVFAQSKIGVLIGLVVGALCIPAIFLVAGDNTGDWISMSLFASIFVVGVFTVVDATNNMMSVSLLYNRFLIQPTGFKKRVFIARKLATMDSLISPETMKVMPGFSAPALCEANCGLYSSKLEYATYCETQWGCTVDFPDRLPIHAVFLGLLPYTQHELCLLHRVYGMPVPTPKIPPTMLSSVKNIHAVCGLLVPELTAALPMPRDMIYLCQHAAEFMPQLERTYNLSIISSRFEEIRRHSEQLLQHNDSTLRNLATLINNATSICSRSDGTPILFREHERLETLGDSVYLFFIALNLFVKHPEEIQYAIDFFDEHISKQGKNKVLYRVARQIGLHRLVHISNVAASSLWSSMYSSASDNESSAASSAPTMSLSGGRMSDIVESLLGATYLADSSGCMTVGFLNLIGPFLPIIDGQELEPSSTWFAGKATCLHEGYPLTSHSGWAGQLGKISNKLRQKNEIDCMLQKKVNGVCQLFAEEAVDAQLPDIFHSDPTALLLMQSALFDESHPELYDLESLAQLRDKMFHVGNAALQLNVISEVHKMHPTSTSGDIHLMKVTLLSQDCLAYIFVKKRFHECLFDTDAEAIQEMRSYMEESDELGEQEWAKHDGWMLPGGVAEFNRRIQKCYDYVTSNQMKQPQYVGLAAGRLWGHNKKLPKDTTDDLQFSFKCIVGALALSVGVRDAWHFLRPFFMELLIMSADDLRQCYPDPSSLASKYKKGKN